MFNKNVWHRQVYLDAKPGDWLRIENEEVHLCPYFWTVVGEIWRRNFGKQTEDGFSFVDSVMFTFLIRLWWFVVSICAIAFVLAFHEIATMIHADAMGTLIAFVSVIWEFTSYIGGNLIRNAPGELLQMGKFAIGVPFVLAFWVAVAITSSIIWKFLIRTKAYIASTLLGAMAIATWNRVCPPVRFSAQ